MAAFLPWNVLGSGSRGPCHPSPFTKAEKSKSGQLMVHALEVRPGPQSTWDFGQTRGWSSSSLLPQVL